MHLDKLKPAWRQYRLANSLRAMEQEDILAIIEQSDRLGISKTHRMLINAAIILFLAICCQGG